MSNQTFEKLAFVASDTPEARDAAQGMRATYGTYALEEADTVIALGGDGLMLETLHMVLGLDVPVYGMNFGSIGFLMNEYRAEGLKDRLESANHSRLFPLAMTVVTNDGVQHNALAFNEVSLFRSSYQAAKIEIAVDGKVRIPELICDGVLVSTPAGSTAYNLSAHGPILPINSPLLALTPISPFRPRRWRGAILSNRDEIKFTPRDIEKRPVNAVADNVEFEHVQSVTVHQDKAHSVTMLFDDGHGLEERVLNEQFQY